jgi:hypothetical protein
MLYFINFCLYSTKRFHLLNIKDTYEGNYHGGWLGGCSVNKLRNVRLIYTRFLTR